MTKILGNSVATAKQMATFLLSKNPTPMLTKSISVEEFCQLYLEICAKEDVRGDIMFAQSCKETNYFKFTGDVKYTQNNFAGIGATGGGVPGNSFPSIEIGILAQAQHAKSYATIEDLKCTNVDPRRTSWFMKTKGGTSPDVETLAGTWAVPGYNTKLYSSLEAANKAKDSYGYQIINILNDILKINIKEETNMTKIAIDAGHGSNTAGKRTPSGYKEHYANVKVAYFFSKAMDRCGIAYMKTGWNDTNASDDPDTDLTTRQNQIKAGKCDYSISFHFNAYGSGTSYNDANGIETIISDKSAGDSLKLANKVQAELIKGTKQTNRSVKKQALAMCNCGKMGTKASILIECGFMTNKYEAELMQTDAFCKECAEEAARGFCNYLGIKYVEETILTTKQVAPSGTTSENFKVKVIDDCLNIRLGPATTYAKVGEIKNHGVYTIVETKGNWGRLLSGAGWISISSKYVTRV